MVLVTVGNTGIKVTIVGLEESVIAIVAGVALVVLVLNVLVVLEGNVVIR